jgi:hypothetical protein
VFPNSGWFTTPHPEISLYRYWVNWLVHKPIPPAPTTTKEGFVKKPQHSHILKAEKKVDLNNVMNFFYIAPLYFGTSVTSMILVYDTGSTWLVGEDSGCSTCLGTNYNTGSSSKYVKKSTTTGTLKYGSAEIDGFLSTDDIWVDSGKSLGINDFPWFLITKQTGLNNYIDGILGMGRPGPSAGPVYLTYLKN